MQTFHERLQQLLRWLQHFSDRPWYPLLVGVLAGLDNWILVVPTDGLVISGTLLSPRRWIQFAVVTAILSSLGALSFAYFITLKGYPFVEAQWPTLLQSQIWILTEDFFHRYGVVVVLLVAMSPLVQQPAVIIAALAKTPYLELGLALLIGRLLKYFFICFLAAKAPQALSKLWGLRKELETVPHPPLPDEQKRQVP